MSVYTQLSHKDFCSFLSLYDQGELISWKGIEAGIENTNYFVNTKRSGSGEHNFVLTIFEYLPKERLPFFIQFMELLADSGLPVPAPVHGLDDQPLREIKGKPCMLQPRLPGHHVDPADLTITQCQAIGENLARIHVAGIGATFSQDDLRGMEWINKQINRLSLLLPNEEAELQASQWKDITTGLAAEPDLPQGLIHADLFVDNVLFEGEQVTGMIDFFQSCKGWLLYDVAVTVNDWCRQPDSLELDAARTEAFLKAYNAVRPFTDSEKRCWHLMHRLACLRFWISRLLTYTYPEDPAEDDQDEVIRHFKDPDEFRDMLELRTEKSFCLTLP
ncbi:homoserine kinase [Parendozoicomonas sp. Alg238-R29]|uniref:homoserine kinase n=1 Tax=Parendozoicomonas sp. Alg238-R29 TaxID=2993446 RepID=UPI00248E3450|nr:homoserine kinase [Parendozoicomonas sp. Alg238-R29]